ncbi:MAG TPA: transporter substrate-binding domain-containing protein [Caulobacteraceae bacterium]|jgi:polar amino acid transport system substrate-binding protein|nr:transporter substrate-binding domain-containing protein [Caulobacteraceae bacterium]
MTARLRAAINLGNPVLAKRGRDGALGGVSVDLARALARQSGQELELIAYDAAARVVEAAHAGAWDVAFLAIDPQRATEIAFTEPYLEIEGVFVVAGEAQWNSLEDLDRPGVRIAVGRGAAYDLHLSRVLARAELVRAPTSAAALSWFFERGLEAAAGIRTAAETFAASRPGLRLIDPPFMTIRQAMAVPIAESAAVSSLQAFLDQALAEEPVARALALIG